MSDLKLRRGDPILATTWNSIIDRLPEDRVGATSALGGLFGSTKIEMENKSASQIELGEIVLIDSLSTDAADEFALAQSGIFEAKELTWHGMIAKYAIATEPAPVDGLFVAVTSGVCLIKLTRQETESTHVMIDPDNTRQGIGTTGGIARILADYGAGFVVASLGEMQRQWHYELTEDSKAPEVTAAKLFDLEGNEIAATIELSDPKSYMDDQKLGAGGTCEHVGNKFYAIQATC